MAIEPPPNVMRAERLRKGQVSTRGMRTGAKTASKDQERDYLERFARLAEDPSPLVPRWVGKGSDPFARLRAQVARVQAKRDSNFWLKWYARGRKLRSAYAHTLLVLKGGRIPSFASLRLRGRDVKFILRGNGLRDKLVAVQNHEDPDARLLGFVEVARRKRLVLVSLPDDFYALAPGGPLPEGGLERILDEIGLEATVEGSLVRCPHAARRVVEHELPALGVSIRLCRACGKEYPQGLTTALEAHVLPPGGRFEDTRRVRGAAFAVRPESAQAELERLSEGASEHAREKSKRFDDVHDDDLLDWAEEAFHKGLDERAKGFVLVGDELWLDDFDAAAERYGENDLEREALRTAFRHHPPRVRASESTVNRLLEDAWGDQARTILLELAAGRLDEGDVAPLAAQRPSEALAALDRLLGAESKFTGFPRFEGLPSPLRLANDLFKAHHTGDVSRLQRRLAEGVRDPATRTLALALGRAFHQGAAIEWQYAPHEKDQALFFEPVARELAAATRESYTAAMARLAEALNVPAPAPRA